MICSAEHWLSCPSLAEEWVARPQVVARRMQVQAVAAAFVIASRKVRGCVGPYGDAEQLLQGLRAEDFVPRIEGERHAERS